MTRQWKIRELKRSLRIFDQETNAEIATVELHQYTDNTMRRANAQLAVAAPQLLEAVLLAEWAADVDHPSGGTVAGCPVCGSARATGHTAACALSHAITRATLNAGAPNIPLWARKKETA